MPFFFDREKRVQFLWVGFDEKLCLSIRHCYRLLSLGVRPWQVARQSGMRCFRGMWFLTLWRGGCAFIFRWAVEGRRRAAPVPAKQCTGQMCGCATHLENAPTASGIFAARRRPLRPHKPFTACFPSTPPTLRCGYNLFSSAPTGRDCALRIVNCAFKNLYSSFSLSLLYIPSMAISSS